MATSTAWRTPTFSFIIVNYRSAVYLPACFSSFQNSTLPEEYECIVVNNDSSENGALRILQKKFDFTLLSLSSNCGFGAAVNRGAERARGDILVCLNPDARFLSGTLRDIARLFDQYPSLGIVGMKLLVEPETPQCWSAGVPMTFIEIVRNHLGVPKSKKLWQTRSMKSVAWVSGAAFAIPRTLFFRLHGFDERFFLYYEDVDLCLRVRKFHKKVVLAPSLRVLHRGSGSMDHAKRQQKNDYYTSQDQYFALHRPWYESILLKLLRGIVRIRKE